MITGSSFLFVIVFLINPVFSISSSFSVIHSSAIEVFVCFSSSLATPWVVLLPCFWAFWTAVISCWVCGWSFA